MKKGVSVLHPKPDCHWQRTGGKTPRTEVQRITIFMWADSKETTPFSVEVEAHFGGLYKAPRSEPVSVV